MPRKPTPKGSGQKPHILFQGHHTPCSCAGGDPDARLAPTSPPTPPHLAHHQPGGCPSDSICSPMRNCAWRPGACIPAGKFKQANTCTSDGHWTAGHPQAPPSGVRGRQPVPGSRAHPESVAQQRGSHQVAASPGQLQAHRRGAPPLLPKSRLEAGVDATWPSCTAAAGSVTLVAACRPAHTSPHHVVRHQHAALQGVCCVPQQPGRLGNKHVACSASTQRLCESVASCHNRFYTPDEKAAVYSVGRSVSATHVALDWKPAGCVTHSTPAKSKPLAR